MSDTNITPEQEEKINEEITLFKNNVALLEVRTKEDYDIAADALLNLKKRMDRVETLRDEILKPIKNSIKEAEAKFKSYLTPFKEMHDSVREKMTVYVNEQYKIEQEETRKKQEEARKEQEQAQKSGQQTAQNAAPAPILAPVKPQSVQTAGGTVSTRKRWTYEILDISLVPKEYLIVDPVKVNGQIKIGIREIPGIKIFETIDLSTRS